MLDTVIVNGVKILAHNSANLGNIVGGTASIEGIRGKKVVGIIAKEISADATVVVQKGDINATSASESTLIAQDGNIKIDNISGCIVNATYTISTNIVGDQSRVSCTTLVVESAIGSCERITAKTATIRGIRADPSTIQTRRNPGG